MPGLALIGSALAAPLDTPVFHASEAADAAGATASATGRPLWELSPFRLSDLDLSPEFSVIGLKQPPCAEATKNETLRAKLELGIAKMRRRDYAAARTLLREATHVVRCLSQPAEASALAQLFLQLGIAEAAGGDRSAASAAFLRAIASDPSLPWDDDHDPALAVGLEEARAAHDSAQKVQIQRGPGTEQLQLWIDGLPATSGPLELPIGAHLIQTLQPTSTLELVLDAANPAPMLAFGSVRDDLVEEIADPKIQMTLGELLTGMSYPQAYVWSGTELWEFESGLWKTIPVPPAPPSPKRRSGAAPLRTAGISSLAAGAVLAGVGAGLVAANPSIELSPQNGPQMVARFGGWGFVEAGAAVAALGLAEIGVSLLLRDPPATEGPRGRSRR